MEERAWAKNYLLLIESFDFLKSISGSFKVLYTSVALIKGSFSYLWLAWMGKGTNCSGFLIVKRSKHSYPHKRFIIKCILYSSTVLCECNYSYLSEIIDQNTNEAIF